MDTRLLAVGDWRGPLVSIACFAALPAFLHVLYLPHYPAGNFARLEGLPDRKLGHRCRL
jgi:hypothetical protein